MKRFTALMVCACLVTAGSAAMTTHLTLDSRRVRGVEATETLRYDASWYASAVQVRITDNGVVIETGGSGTKKWTAADGQYHHLQLIAVDGSGTQVGSESADFIFVSQDGVAVIPEDWTEIPAGLFDDCDRLTSVTIPASVTGIGTGAFAGCDDITSVSVPANLNVASVFADSKTKITQVTMTGTGAVPASAYAGCTALTRVDAATLSDWLGLSFANTTANPLSTGAKLFIGGEELISLVIPDGTTGIGNYAFSGTALTSVTIPSSVTSIGTGAFAGCDDITSVTVPANLNVASVFADSKTKITQVTIMGTGAVPASAYAGCTALARVEVASLSDWLGLSFANTKANPLSTGAKLFSGGAEMSSLVIPDGTTSIGDYAFAGASFTSVTIPASVTGIGTGAFAGCDDITSVTVPANLNVASVFADSKTKITQVTMTGTGAVPASAYAGCTALTRVDAATLSDWLGLSFANTTANPLSTGAKLFIGGEELTSFVIPDGTTGIGNYAFSGTALTSVTIPSSVTSIGTGAFAGCDDITSVTVPANLNVASVFADSKTKITQVTIMGTGAVPASAYAGCTALARVDVASVADWLALSFEDETANPLSTGAKLYVGGTELASVVIPDGTTSIGDYAFAGTALTSVTIPSSVTNVAATAFSGCRNIRAVAVNDAFGVESETTCCTVTSGGWTDLGAGQYQSESIGHSQATEMSVLIDLQESQSCSFRWKVSSETNYDKLEYSVDGTVKTNISGSKDWTTVTLSLAAGTHTISWRYYKDGSTASGYDCGWVDVSSLLAMKEVVSQTDLKSLFPDSYSEIRSVTLTGEREVIEAGLLSGCASLTTLVIPDTVKFIEPGAFDDCPLLENINYPDGLEDFGLDVIPPKVRTKLGLAYDADGFMIWNGWLLDYANRDAWSLAIPGGVIGIGHEALSDMAYMDSVEWPEGVRYIASRAFRNDTYLDNLVIPDSVEIIAADAFRGCSYLQNLTIGDGLKTIGDRAFWGCSQLARFSSGAALETIGEAAFSNCWRMQSIALPAGMKSVDPTAFKSCTSVTGLTTPSGVARLADWFGPIVSQIKSVTVPAGETNVLPDMFLGCSSITMVDLHSGVTNIGARAFKNCSSLATLKLSDTLVSLGAEAFRGCSSLKAFVMPATVTTMGESALRDCSSLKELTLSRGLTAIPDYAMSGCSSLDSFTVPESVTYLGSNFFASRTTAIYYRGVAPQYDANAYANARSDLTSYVWRPADSRTPTGWDGSPTSRDLPATWPTTGSYQRAIEWWTPNQYDVTFDANGGIFAPVSSNTYACEQITYTWYSLPPFEPTRVGYKFNGYWTERTGGTRIYTSTGVSLTKPHTLYAQWVVTPTVTVRFNANGGTVNPDTRIYNPEEPYYSFPVPTREHYQFAGWYTESVGGRAVVESTAAPNADQELFAHWTPCRYTIRFHANNGTGSYVDQSFTYGNAVTLRANTFSCPGCSFAGWALNPGAPAAYANGNTLTDVANIEDNVIHLWACWSGDTYVVRFDSHGGEGVIPNQTFVIGIAQPLTKNVFTREGFQFGGWALATDADAVYADGQSVADLTTAKGATVVLYAVWVRANGKSLVTFEANGGTLSTYQVFYTSKAAYGSLPVPTRTGYTFVKWTTREGTTVTGSSIMTQTDITLYAVWKANTYTIVYLANGGAGTMADMTATYDMPTNLVANAFTRAGYTFEGWALAENSEVAYEDEATVSNLTAIADGVVRLHAAWRMSVVDPPVVDPTPGPGTDPEVDPTTPGTDPTPGPGTDPEVDPTTPGTDPTPGPGTDPEVDPTTPGTDPTPGPGTDPEVDPEPEPGLYTDEGEINPASPAYVLPVLFKHEAQVAFAGNATYNGWVRQGGKIVGMLSVKSGKAGKDGSSKLTVAYTPLGGKKQSIKLAKSAMPQVDGTPVVDLPGLGRVKLGADSLAGVDIDVEAGPDLSKSKDKAEKAAYTAKLARKVGVWTFAFNTAAGYAAFSVTVDKKGKGKLAGTLPDGTKVSLSSQGTLGDHALAVPFAYSKKGTFGFVFWVNDDGTVAVSDATAVKTATGSTLAVASWTAPSAVHRLADGAATLKVGSIAQTFTVAGKKWTFPKSQKKLGADDPNPYGTKLSFTEKTGVVKGSFTLVNAAGKKVKYTVNGVVVGGKFYGNASAKGASPMKATAE